MTPIILFPGIFSGRKLWVSSNALTSNALNCCNRPLGSDGQWIDGAAADSGMSFMVQNWPIRQFVMFECYL